MSSFFFSSSEWEPDNDLVLKNDRSVRSQLQIWKCMKMMVKAGWDFTFLPSHKNWMNCAPREHICMSVKHITRYICYSYCEGSVLEKPDNDLLLQKLVLHIKRIHISSTFHRPFHHGGEVTEAWVREADRVRSGHDQNLRQLPLLQPQWLALLPVCRGSGELLCPETQKLQSQQVRCFWFQFKSQQVTLWIRETVREHLPR